MRDSEVEIETSEKQRRSLPLAGVVMIAAICLVAGIALGTRGDFMARVGAIFGLRWGDSALNLDSVNSVYSELARDFDGDLDTEALVEGAKKGLVEAAGDPYTTYMTSAEAAEYTKSLNGDVGAGIGVEVGMRDGFATVVKVLKDNPALKAGVKAGDVFAEVNGEDVLGMTTEEVVTRVKGETGTSVAVVFARDGELKSFNITRAQINNPSSAVEYRGENGKVAVIRVSRFDQKTGSEMQDIAQEIVSKGIDKIVLDLRGNGGGYLASAQNMLSLWLDDKVMMIEKTKDDQMEMKTWSGRAVLAGKETLVLIDGGSASASEIVAGALKDHGMAELVGETTFGKASVQDMVEVAGGILKVSIARWFTPNDVSITGDGIKPDQEVKMTFDDANAGRDPQLDKALQLLKEAK